MVVTIQTKISDIIRENEQAIEVISSINTHFRKLRNPILRKLLASKVTLEQAARIGNVSSELMLNKLKEIGFEVAHIGSDVEENRREKDQIKVHSDKLSVLDVRPYINSGKDPFSVIMKEVKNLPYDYTLLIINSFEPVPLISILSSQGFISHTVKESEDLYKIYFQVKKEPEVSKESGVGKPISYSELLESYNGNLKEIDVRDLDMPYPMITILNELTELEPGSGLLIHHKRIPQFLLPRLDEQKVKYAFNRISEDYFLMIIVKE